MTYGRPLARQDDGVRPLYASPALSPDGRRVAFFSERGLISVDLFVADTDTGRGLRKLTDTAVDSHFSNLQFLASSGAWRPDGRAIAVAAVRSGRPALAILDVESGERVRDIDFPSLGEILHPSWSPDGRAIAFSATAGGYSDLYVYDLDRSALRQLTNDRYADLQPAWSPDGDRLAFVTDRFTTNLDRLDSGPYRLALADATTGAVVGLETFAGAKSINPQWAADGRTIFFLSDRGGVTNIFAIDTSTGDLRQMTNLDTGISGITALSPALSSAGESPRLAFSAYSEERLSIFITSGDRTGLAGEPVTALRSRPSAAALPPEARASSDVSAFLADAATGLPDTAELGMPTVYRSRLSLDWVGQPYAGVGLSRFGPSFGGGLSMLWSDMLGNHTLSAAVDVSTTGTGVSDLYKDFAGGIAYQNLTRKWDWGTFVQQQPYVAGGFLTGIGSIDGQPAFVEQRIIQRQTLREVGVLAARPVSRARRFEFSTGYQRLSFEEDVRTTYFSTTTGAVIQDDRSTSALAESLNLGTITAAAVSDNAVFGATSPVAGGRSRFEITPTFGSLGFTSALADYRRYVMPVSFYTIATQVMHYGRYGSDGEDSRLLPLYLGYPNLVRGYAIGSFDASECTRTASSTCEEFDRLLGSRMLLGKVEFRFPLLRPFGASGSMYGPIPTEVALFADAGVAWTSASRPSFLDGDRDPISSAGLSLRVNIFGFAVAQIDLARPFQRQGRGFLWGFSLTPGF
jgi:WD40 repeat protein